MKVAIMQPYFLPYIGYFQLIGAVDRFVIYDNIKYTKKGWINRNRFLLNGSDSLFGLPLSKDSDALDVRNRKLSEDFDPQKLLAQLRGAYRKAPMFSDTFGLLEELVTYPERNLFDYIHHSIKRICAHLGIKTPVVISSSLPADHSLAGKDRVLALCKALKADSYLNPIGGTELYSKEEFHSSRVELHFLKSRTFEYPQFGDPFVPWLSIVDVLMFNPIETVAAQLREYDLV